MEDFTYMDEPNISSHLKCDECDKPLVNPVSLDPCERTYCRRCIQPNLQKHSNDCPACQNKTLTGEDLHIVSRALRKMLDDLLVRCSLCNAINIPRIKFEEHQKNVCPRRIISCPGEDVMCQWTGQRDQLDDHLRSCPYQQIRDNLKDLIGQSVRLQQVQKSFNDLQNQFQQIESEKKDLNKELEKIRLENRSFSEQSIQQTDQINQLNEQIAQLNTKVDKLKPLQPENQHLKEQMELQLSEINKLKEENQLLKEEIDRLKKFEQEHKDLSEQVNELGHWKTDYQSIENQILEYQNRIQRLEEVNKLHQETLQSLEPMEIERDQLHQLCEQLKSQIQVFYVENEQFKQQWGKVIRLNEDHQNLSRLHAEQRLQLDSLQEETQSLQKENQNAKEEIQNLKKEHQNLKEENQDLTKENLNLKERIDNDQLQIEHRDIKIKQLQTKPLSQPQDLSVNYNYENKNLKELIDQYGRNSLISLNNIKLNGNDMNILIDFGLIYQKCHAIILGNNSLTINSTLKLFSSLSWNGTLTKLVISNNPLSDESMKCLCDSLSYYNRTLKEIVLRSNEISDQGLIYFSDTLKSNETLITIGLQENRISDQSIQYLSTILFSYPNSVENLSLYSNKLITDLSVQSFIQITQKTIPLKSFWIWDCQLSDQGKDQIKQSTQSNIHLDLILQV